MIKAFAVLLVAGAVAALPAPEEKYSDKFDNVNVDEILDNDRILDQYILCLKGKAPCTPDGKFLKDIIPDAMKTNCSKCTDKQRVIAEKMMRYMAQHRRAEFHEIEDIYDPDCVFRKSVKEEMMAKGIDIGTCKA